MFLFTIGALIFMLFGSVILVSTNIASLGSFYNIIIFILVVTSSLGRVVSHVDHLICHLMQQLGLGFQKPLHGWIYLTGVGYKLSCHLVQLGLGYYEFSHVVLLVVVVTILDVGVSWRSHLFGLGWD